MDAELARRLLKAVGSKRKAGGSTSSRPASQAGVVRKAGKAKGPWVTVQAEHLEVLRLTADEDQPGPVYVVESTVTGKPERSLGAGLLEGKVAPETNATFLDRWEVVEGRVRPVDAGRDPRLFERRERIDAPDNRGPQPNPPRTGAKRMQRKPRLWTGQPTDGSEV
jgi:hypothetical protein